LTVLAFVVVAGRLTAFETAFAAALAAFAAVFAALPSVFAAVFNAFAVVFDTLAFMRLALALAFEALLVLAVSPQAIPKAPSARRAESAIIFLI
jgi:hypothetical protein